MDIRAQLQDRLTEYVKDTFGYIETARHFCDQEEKWSSERRAEIEKMRHIHVNQEELDDVLKDTLKGLKKLEPFLETLEKLNVTSSHVFSEQIFLQQEEKLKMVQSVIEDARTDAPLLILFKRDAESFFRPRLDNVNIMVYQLDSYTVRTKQLCRKIRQKWKTEMLPSVKFTLNMNEEVMTQMLDHLKQLCEIRMNQDTRLMFLFQDDAQTFIDVFSERRSRMSQFLSDLEHTADKLHSMKLGASISNVVGSSVGIVGGVLGILGIVFAPFTGGASFGLTAAGFGLGVTSAANAAVTGVTESYVNSHHEQNAQSYLENYKEDMIKIEECLNEVANSERPLVKPSAVDVKTILQGSGEVLSKVVDGLAAYAERKSERLTAAATEITMQELETAHEVQLVTRYMSRTEQLAKTSGIVKVTRVASGILNALFIGLDTYFIVDESISLHHGSETEASSLIRARAALFKSELEAWENMYESLRRERETFNKNKETLEKAFLP